MFELGPAATRPIGGIAFGVCCPDGIDVRCSAGRFSQSDFHSGKRNTSAVRVGAASRTACAAVFIQARFISELVLLLFQYGLTTRIALRALPAAKLKMESAIPEIVECTIRFGAAG